MIRLLTASKSDLLLQCSYAFADDVIWELEDNTDDEAINYGNAFHQYMAAGTAALGGLGAPELIKLHHLPEHCVRELHDHGLAATRCLEDWLSSEGLQERPRVIERAVAWNPETNKARWCAPTDAEHNYPDRRPGEIPGTMDLALLPGPRKAHQLVVLDYKTGADIDNVAGFEHPENLGQLLTLSCALTALTSPRGTVVQAILHAPRGAAPTIYAARIDQHELDHHRYKIVDALRRRGDGSMRPGPHCKSLYCAARPVCPTRGGDILLEASALLPAAQAQGSAALTVANDATLLTREELVGRSHYFREKIGALLDQLKKNEKEALEELGTAIRPDGVCVELVDKSRRNLSLGGIEKALGKLRGAKEIERLTKLGCITVSEWKEIRKVPER